MATNPQGYIPPDPREAPKQRVIEFCRSPINESAIRLGGLGYLQQWSFAFPAHPYHGPQAVEQIHLTLCERELPDGLIDRIVTCAGEIIPNACQHGRRDSRIGIVLMIYGQAPRRVIELLVENFLAPSQHTIRLRVNPNNLQSMIDHLRGRGLTMSALVADELTAAIRPGYSLLVTAFFDESSDKNTPDWVI